jgi:hypothetical protein
MAKPMKLRRGKLGAVRVPERKPRGAKLNIVVWRRERRGGGDDGNGGESGPVWYIEKKYVI